MSTLRAWFSAFSLRGELRFTRDVRVRSHSLRGISLATIIAVAGCSGESGAVSTADAGRSVAPGTSSSAAMTVSVDGQAIELPNVKRAGFLASDASKDHYTIISAATDRDRISFTLHAPGQAPGTFRCNDGSITRIVQLGDGMYVAGLSGTGDEQGECSIEISEYGGVGEGMVGSFTATMKKGFGSSSLPAERKVSGTFRFTRQESF